MADKETFYDDLIIYFSKLLSTAATNILKGKFENGASLVMISTIMLCLIHTYLKHNGPNSFLKEHSFLYFKIIHDPRISYQVRDVGVLGVGNAMTSTHVGRTVNPISAVHSAEEAHYQSYAQQITTCPPEFPDLPTALQVSWI